MERGKEGRKEGSAWPTNRDGDTFHNGNLNAFYYFESNSLRDWEVGLLKLKFSSHPIPLLFQLEVGTLETMFPSQPVHVASPLHGFLPGTLVDLQADSVTVSVRDPKSGKETRQKVDFSSVFPAQEDTRESY